MLSLATIIPVKILKISLHWLTVSYLCQPRNDFQVTWGDSLYIVFHWHRHKFNSEKLMVMNVVKRQMFLRYTLIGV